MLKNANSMSKKIYVYGYGNPGRQDDGIGPCLADRVAALCMADVTADSNYQLNVEDVVDISAADLVFFVDASAEGDEPFEFSKLEPASEIRFTTHTISPESLIALCKEIYDKDVPAYLLAVRGYSWDFDCRMTPEATLNMEQAFGFLTARIRQEQIVNLH